MDYIFLSVLCAITGTATLILVYLYLYVTHRKAYMAAWIIGWLLFSLRLILFDSNLFEWQKSFGTFTIYQIISISTILLFLWSTHLFTNKVINNQYFWGAATTFAISTVLAAFNVPLLYKLIPLTWFAGIIITYIGITFLQTLHHSIGRLISGYSFVLWGIQTLCMPFLISSPHLAAKSYLLGGFLRLLIASGTIMVYVEAIKEDLTNKESQYRLLAENAVDIIYRYMLHPEKKLNYISPSIQVITGYTPDECYADSNLIPSSISPEDQNIVNIFSNDFKHTSDEAITFRFTRKDKQVIWLEHKQTPILAEDGRCLAIEGILRDVTARKNLENLTVKLDRLNMAGQMAVNVAHEIRNPLTTVRGYLQMLGRKKEACSKCRERFDWMLIELDKACGIISEYLLLSQDKRMDLKTCSLNLLITELFPLLQASAGAAKAQLALELAPAPEIRIDENEIRQLVIHLVRNAMESMPSGGIITIRTTTEADKVSLSVSDQGCGLPENILANLGTPFLTTKPDGAGLGLSICYQIASRHHATLTANTGTGGTTFFVHFIRSSQAA